MGGSRSGRLRGSRLRQTGRMLKLPQFDQLIEPPI